MCFVYVFGLCFFSILIIYLRQDISLHLLTSLLSSNPFPFSLTRIRG